MNISDVIEEFIKNIMGESEAVNISRNELAQFFDCAPSQINYVLATRFTLDKGFVIESRRGSGGFISVSRIKDDRKELINHLLEYTLSEGVSERRAAAVIERLKEEDFFGEKEARIMKAVTSDRALSLPGVNKDILRAFIIKTVVAELSKEEN